ncbi:MAG: urea ABC transporter substrate-binding protein [Gammaproteobacteria bacterium]|nr:MAG: urea ABC transporter substrate-binding protein [Gammaproteobacteria bacterium]
MNIFSELKIAIGIACIAAVSSTAVQAQEDTIKVGILHSLSGTMAISETTLKDTVLMMIERQNAAGGLLGRQLEPVVVDPASDWPMFAEKARELIELNDVAVTFGCWTSVSRKSVLPVFEEFNSMLFYPVQYEGEESSKSVFYTGAAPNQQAIPAVDYLMNEIGVERWVLAGTDYVYPRTTNRILEAYLKSQGVVDDDIMINYTPFGHSDWQSIISDINNFGSTGRKTAVVSTINGDANVPFYIELGTQRVFLQKIYPSLHFPWARRNYPALIPVLCRTSSRWNYFMSIPTEENDDFIDGWLDFIGDDDRVSNDPMEAHYIGFNMWAEAVTKAGTPDPEAVQEAIIGVPSESDRWHGHYDAQSPYY